MGILKLEECLVDNASRRRRTWLLKHPSKSPYRQVEKEDTPYLEVKS